MYVKKPRDIGKVVKSLYEKQGLEKELVARFLRLDTNDLDSFENGYHVVNAFDLERFCALFCCKLCPDGIDTAEYRDIDIAKPLDELKLEDLETVASRHLETSNLIYTPQI